MAQNEKIKKLFGSNTKIFKSIFIGLAIILLLLILMCMFKTCRECNPCYQRKIIDKTGYLPENEDWENIPDVIPPFNNLDSLSESVSLEHLFPPIGDQQEKGTCVAWAVGYNLKTALNAIDKHWTREQLDRMLEALVKQPVKESIMGAMCYITCWSSERIEHICPVCATRTYHELAEEALRDCVFVQGLCQA